VTKKGGNFPRIPRFPHPAIHRMHDLRFALRQLRQAPGFAVVAVATLALGIGLSATIFNGVNPLLFRPLPFRDPETLVYLNERNPKQGFERMSVSYADFRHWRDENQVFSDLGVWGGASFTLGHGDGPERIEGCEVSARLFATLGLTPALGRGFTATEDEPGAPAVVLLGDRLWQRRFGGDPKIVGQTITLNAKPYTVIGVMPPRVRFPNDADLWVPLVVEQPEKRHGNFSYAGAARLKPGVTLAQARSDLAAIHERIAQETPRTNAHVGAVVLPIAEGFLEADLRAMGWTMLGAVAFVLAVACANVASLFLARALGRQKEFAVRLALGASRWRLLRQLLAESLTLGTVAGLLGLLFSVWGLGLLLRLVPVEIPYWIDFTLDWRVFAFAAGASLLTSLAFGLAPAWQVSRTDVLTGLNETARGSSGGRRRQGLRSVFVVAEVALATLLLCGTGLMIRSLLNLQQVDPGFNPARLAVFYLDLSSIPTAEADARITFFTTLTERLRALPGVQAAAACSSLPLSGRNNGQGFAIEGQPPPEPGRNPVGNLRVVTPGYFAAMEIPLLRGRDFSAVDSATGAKVIIVDAAFARQYFGEANPIGQRIRWSLADPATSMEIIGIAKDVKHSSLDREGRTGFYIPHAQSARRLMGVVLRTKTDQPLGVMSGVRQALRELDPTLALYQPREITDMIQETYWIRRFLGRLLVGFAALALALAAVGIASIVAYAVTQRTQEIGVRMALGAQAADVLRLLLGQGMRLVLGGLALGLLASLGLAQVLANQLYGIGWIDPLTLLASAGLFVGVALLACWLPARRATRVNPVEALRAE
jgi:putative ABC transport system permease protein